MSKGGKEIVAQMKVLTLQERQEIEKKYPARPGAGKLGTKISLQVNVIPMAKLPNRDIYHYDVKIDPTVPPKFNRLIFYEFEQGVGAEKFGGAGVAYDGRNNMFTNKELPSKSMTVDFEYKENERVRHFKLTFKLVAQVNTQALQEFIEGRLNYTPQDAIMAMDVILRHGPGHKMAIVGRSLFTPVNRQGISGGVEIWPGYFSALRASQGKAYWNVDTAYTAFYREQSVVDFLMGYGDKRSVKELEQLRDMEMVKMERTMKTIRVQVNHLKTPRKYRVNALTRQPASKTFFTDESGTKQSVADYFAKKYRPLKYPDLPCLHVGNPEKKVYIPLELCSVVPGQKYPKKLNEDQTSEMIKIACKKPHERFNQIKAGLQLLQQHQQGYLDKFGIQVGTSFARVEGRILPTPTVYYHEQSREASIVPQNGAWNLKDKKADSCGELRSWAVMNLAGPRDASPQAVDAFLRELVSTCQVNGMNVAVKNPPVINSRTGEQDVNQAITKALAEAEKAAKAKCQLVLCIMPRGNTTELYGRIKRIFETQIGIPTQCMLSKHCQKANKQYCANLFLKINSKLGGTNLSLGGQLPFIREKPTIVFGADVSHGGVGDRGKPSIAAVVASMDHKLSKYASRISIQGPREEIIVNMKDIVKNLLIAFFQASKFKPQRILFYRDGVSEGQFEMVQQVEIQAIQQACAELDPNYKPPITFIIIQKRHNIRFLPEKKDADRSDNVKPGTVIDTAICHPRFFDFFLCSHSGIQGTSRPTRYFVVQDQNNFNADSLQELTYRMCYTFARCTRSVSVVPPAYYAHLVAFRGKIHMGDESFSDTASTVSSTQLQEQAKQLMSSFPHVVNHLDKTMYFI